MMKKIQTLTKVSTMAFASLIAYTPDSIAQTGLFADAEEKGDQLFNEIMGGPMKMIAAFAFLGAAFLCIIGKIPLRFAAMICVGSILVGSVQEIVDFFFE